MLISGKQVIVYIHTMICSTVDCTAFYVCSKQMEHIRLCKVRRKGKSFTICNSFYECIHKSNEFYLTKEIYLNRIYANLFYKSYVL